MAGDAGTEREASDLDVRAFGGWCVSPSARALERRVCSSPHVVNAQESCWDPGDNGERLARVGGRDTLSSGRHSDSAEHDASGQRPQNQSHPGIVSSIRVEQAHGRADNAADSQAAHANVEAESLVRAAAAKPQTRGDTQGKRDASRRKEGGQGWIRGCPSSPRACGESGDQHHGGPGQAVSRRRPPKRPGLATAVHYFPLCFSSVIETSRTGFDAESRTPSSDGR